MDFLRAKEGRLVSQGEVNIVTIFNMLHNILLSRDLAGLEEEGIESGIKSLVTTAMEVSAAQNVSDFYPFLGKLDLQGLHKKTLKFLIKIRCTHPGSPLSKRKEVEIHQSSKISSTTCSRTELFQAVTDTSTSTIQWKMAELVKNPEKMKQVHEELQREIKHNFLRESHPMQQLPYLEACVKEALHLHPPAPLLLPHHAHQTCQLTHRTIPKNAQVSINVWAIG
ncbi:corytuberine synthase-like [Coffea eugenioides]|uniref:corytuberine synthase-like n=1 Tax=Coffea eugenioides TaxID=49369 RepID=UPI000F611C12|nr:corytuberine synthase-like [Coffea eugenioides]